MSLTRRALYLALLWVPCGLQSAGPRPLRMSFVGAHSSLFSFGWACGPVTKTCPQPCLRLLGSQWRYRRASSPTPGCGRRRAHRIRCPTRPRARRCGPPCVAPLAVLCAAHIASIVDDWPGTDSKRWTSIVTRSVGSKFASGPAATFGVPSSCTRSAATARAMLSPSGGRVPPIELVDFDAVGGRLDHEFRPINRIGDRGRP
jgi:hypothetical protein